MTNKEAIEKIQTYLLAQNQEVVCRICAALMIDINRIDMINQLDGDEYNCLVRRVALNAQMVRDFIEGKESSGLFYETINSE